MLGKAATVGGFALAVVMGAEVASSEPTSELRRKLIWPRATGKVLETCAGRRSANLAYYDFDHKVTQLVLVDKVEQQQQASLPPKVTAVVTSTLDQFPSHEFDTIVDTMGLCALDDPGAYLADMKRVLKPTGQVLFLEHGRSAAASSSSSAGGRVVNWVLDAIAPVHLALRGCRCNLDMASMIQQAGFRIHYSSTIMFHTTTVLVATPQP